MHYCPACGQENRRMKRTVLDFIREGFSSFLQLEGRSWTTLRDLAVPGKVAQNYLNGQRQRYLHPLRLLVLSSLVFFGAIALTDFVLISETDEETSDTTQIHFEAGSDGNTPAQLEPDDLTIEHTPVVDTTWRYRPKPHPLAERMRTVDLMRARIIAQDFVEERVDQLRQQDFLATPAAQAVADSMQSYLTLPQDQFDLTIAGKEYPLLWTDLAEQTPDELASHLGAESFIARLAVRKAASILGSGIETLSEYLTQNLSWVVLLFVPLMAIGYRLFYWRRLPYYAQHLTFVAFTSSALLLLAALAVLIGYTTHEAVGLPIFLLGAPVYILLSERKLFQYHLGKVMLKGVGLALYGTLAFTFAVLLWVTFALLAL